MKVQYSKVQQLEIDHYTNVLEDYSNGLRKVVGSDGKIRNGNRHDILGFIRDKVVRDAVEEIAEKLNV